MASVWGEVKDVLYKGIDAYVDIEKGSDTQLGREPVQVVKADDNVIRAGAAGGAVAAGVSPWVWVAGAGLLGLVYMLAKR